MHLHAGEHRAVGLRQLAARLAPARVMWFSTPPEAQGATARHFDAAVLDMERIAMRLDVFEMYAFLASLTAGFSFNCLNEFDALPEFEKRCPSRLLYYPVAFAFAFSLVASIFCGLYTTCVFALCSLYSKTALAEQNDERMRGFLQQTACAIAEQEVDGKEIRLIEQLLFGHTPGANFVAAVLG